MRISRRTSGGRGEYEISEDSPEGLTPSDILQRHIQLDFGAGWILKGAALLHSQKFKDPETELWPVTLSTEAVALLLHEFQTGLAATLQ